MTRACTCGAVMGEKCRQCGAPAVPVGNPPDRVGQLYRCSGDCVYYFRAGDGGVTRGLCPACLQQEEAALVTVASKKGVLERQAQGSASLAAVDCT